MTHEKDLSEDLAEERRILKQVNKEVGEKIDGFRKEQAHSEEKIEALEGDVGRLELKLMRA